MSLTDMLLFLTADTESLDDRSVTLNILLDQVIKQAATLTDHFQQSPAGVMVFFVGFEVICQIGDSLCCLRSVPSTVVSFFCFR